MRWSPARLLAAFGLSSAALLSSTLPALAHEHRDVGSYQFTVGWKSEPAFAGNTNAVQVTIKDSANRPVQDLGDTLKVEVTYGSQASAPLALHPAWGSPGEYDAPIMPTRPGDYTFHFVGTIHGQPIDASFSSSPKTFDSVTDNAAIAFPISDPSPAALAERLDRVDSRVQLAQSQLQQAREDSDATRRFALAGLGVGLLSLGTVAVAARGLDRRRASALSHSPGSPSA